MSIVAMNISVSIIAGLAIFQLCQPLTSSLKVVQVSSFIYTTSLIRCLLYFHILSLLLFLQTVTSSVVMLESMGNITNQDNRKRAKWSMIWVTFVFGILQPFPTVSWQMSKSLVSLTPWFLGIQPPHAFWCPLIVLFTGFVFKKHWLWKSFSSR